MSAANRSEAADADADADADPDGPPSGPSSPPEHRLWTRPFLRLLAMQAAFGFSFSVFLLLPKVLAASFGSSADEIGLVMAAFGVASLLAIPVVGRVVDRLGHGRTLVLANLIMAAGALAFMLVRGVGAPAVLLRGVHGLAWSLAFAAAMAAAADLAPPQELAQAIGIVGGASLLMNAVAPAIAEPLGDWLGYRAIFALAGGAALVGAALARRLPAGGGSHPAQVRATSVAPAAAPPARATAYVLLAVSGLAFGALFTFIAPFALQHGIRAVRGFFMAYTVAALAVRVAAGRLADRWGHARVAGVAAVGYGLTVAVTGLVGPGPLLALGVSFGAAHGALFPALMAMLLSGTPAPARARTLGIANGAMNLGITAVFALGLAASRFGYARVLVLAGALTLVATAVLARRRSPHMVA